MTFGNPAALYGLLVIPPLAALLYYSWKLKTRDLQAFTGVAFESLLASTLSKKRQRWKDVLWLCGILLAMLALARPQWGEKWEETRRRGMDILVAVDLSKSMLAGDVSPSRLERAQRKITDLVPLLQGDRIGLIGFAGRAYVFMPLTLDYNALPLFIDSLAPESISLPGTSVAQAIALALQSFESGSSPDSHSVIVMSDGEDLEGDVGEAVTLARDKGVQINALGIGTSDGAPIPEPGGGFKKDSSGNLVLTRLDESTLATMARETGGAYVRSVASDDDLKLIYGTIRRGRDDKELKGGIERRFIDRYQWFLAIGILLLVIEALMRDTRKIAVVSILLMLLSPTSLHAFGTIGQIREGEHLYEQGKYNEALQKFLQAEKKQPNDPRLQYNLGNTYHQLERYDEAAKAFSRIPSGDPKLQEKSLYNQGNNLYRQGSLENAVRSYEEALKLDPKDDDAQFNLDFVKKMLEQKKEQEKNQENKDKQEQQQDREEQSKQDQKGSRNEDGTTESEDRLDQALPGQTAGANDSSSDHQMRGAGGGAEPSPDKMSRDQAERWLGGVREVRPRVQEAGQKKSGGGGRVEKDW